MIFGVDISSYQGSDIPDNTHDRGAPAFVIINARDPGLGDKARVCERRSVPWWIYTWVFPNQNQRDNVRWTALVLDQAGLDWRKPIYWLDYEQGGVDPAQLDVALDAADELGVRRGVYTYLFLYPQVEALITRRKPDLWLAYYPGNNDGTYPQGQERAAIDRGARIWQFSSNANGPVGLDENVIIDEAWFAQWGQPPTPPVPPAPVMKETDVLYRATTDSTVNPDVKAGSIWDNVGTRFLPVDSVPAGVIVRDVAGDDIGVVSADQAEQRAAARVVLARPMVNVDAVVAATTKAIDASPKGTSSTKSDHEQRVEIAVRAALQGV